MSNKYVLLGTDRDILLEPESTVMTQLEELRLLLKPPDASITRNCNSLQFVSVYKNSLYYYAKSFPVLFPFGRGCPSDANSKLTDIKLHSQKMLRRGGGPQGRRFQQTPGYYFTVYSYLMKQKIGGGALLAQRATLDGTAQPENIPTVGEVSRLLNYLGSPDSNLGQSDIQQNNQLRYTTQDTVDIQKLVSRLVPYSKNIPGTEMSIRYERKNLMALIPSPVINADGYWRWFITFAPADLYESRLYEIACKEYNENYTWKERQTKVSKHLRTETNHVSQH